MTTAHDPGSKSHPVRHPRQTGWTPGEPRSFYGPAAYDSWLKSHSAGRARPESRQMERTPGQTEVFLRSPGCAGVDGLVGDSTTVVIGTQCWGMWYHTLDLRAAAMQFYRRSMLGWAVLAGSLTLATPWSR
jgi:hypothetical protein